MEEGGDKLGVVTLKHASFIRNLVAPATETEGDNIVLACQFTPSCYSSTHIPVYSLEFTTWGLRGSVVACVTCKQEIAVRSSAALNVARRCAPRQGTLLTRALSRPRCKWVPGRTVKASVCWNSSVCQRWQPGCMLPRELRWLINEQILWPRG